jgi:hypothetical protein
VNTSQSATRLARLLLGLAALSLSSCADDTSPPGATISSPSDLTITYSNSPGFDTLTASPLAFQVLDADGNPSPGVAIRFFAGGGVNRLADRTGAALTTADPALFETTADEQGLSPTDVYARFSVPACDPAEDVSNTGTVTASVGVASATWTVTVTAKSCP